MVMGLCCFDGVRTRKKNKNHNVQKTDGISSAKNIRLFSYNELKSATWNFHPSNRIGSGGFGVVYKGTLKNETVVAIKSLSTQSKQGTQEFLTEIDTISNIRHPNLVQLIGCCIEGDNRMLVYEYLKNNSLRNALLGPRSKRISLDWCKRAAICIGTAHGLAFLHEEVEPPIVHRDIKASNVLLDNDLTPKIGDFGLAKLFPDNVTHISTRVAGTAGYLAPEYALLAQLTKKADIYSFGVLMLEIISGRSSTRETFGADSLLLLEWTWKLREENRLLELVDPALVKYPEAEVLRFIKVALFCTQAAANQRPSMKQVVTMLSKETHLNEKLLMRPGILTEMDSFYKDSGHSSQVNNQSEKNSSLVNKDKHKATSSTLITSTINLNGSPLTQLQPR